MSFKKHLYLKKRYISAFTGATCLPSPWVFLWLSHLSATANAQERWINIVIIVAIWLPSGKLT